LKSSVVGTRIFLGSIHKRLFVRMQAVSEQTIVVAALHLNAFFGGAHIIITTKIDTPTNLA